MEQITTTPLSSSCTQLFKQQYSSTPLSKDMRKALAMMQQGIGKTDDIYKNVDLCVLPKEASGTVGVTLSTNISNPTCFFSSQLQPLSAMLTNKGLDINTCPLSQGDSSETPYTPKTTFAVSQGNLMSSDPSQQIKDVQSGKGVYPVRGCAIPANNDAFVTGVRDIANALSVDIRNDITQLKATACEWDNKVKKKQEEVNAATIVMNDKKQKLANERQNWENTKAYISRTQDTDIPRYKADISIYNVWSEFYEGPYWSSLNSYGKSLANVCTLKSQAKARSNSVVQLFQHCWYGGWAITLDPNNPNDRNVPWIEDRLRGSNDNISSVKIPPGVTVRLYEHAWYGGKYLDLTSDTMCLVDYGFNDICSSVKIFGSPNAAGSSYTFSMRTPRGYIGTPVHVVGVWNSKDKNCIWPNHSAWQSWSGSQSANWITQYAPYYCNASCTFYKTFTSSYNTRGTIYINSDNNATVYVNDVQVGTSGAWWSTTTMSTNIVQGTNKIRIVLTQGEGTQATGGILFSLKDNNTQVTLVVSDATWSVQ